MKNKALIAILGSVLLASGSKRIGSFGKKKNKLLSKFSQELSSILQHLLDASEIDDEDELKTLSQCIEDRPMDENDLINAPEVMGYASFYWGVLISAESAMAGASPYRIPTKAKSIRDYFLKMCNECGYNPADIQSISELNSLVELEWAGKWFDISILREDIFYYAVSGLILERAMKAIVSLSSDKNLSEMYTDRKSVV